MTVLNPIGVEHGAKYVIIGPDGTRAVINDSADADFVGFVDVDNGGIAGLERAGVREVADVLPEADGGVHGRFLYDRLSFSMNLIIPPGVGLASWLQRQAMLKRATDAMAADALLCWTPSEAPAVQLPFRQQQPTRISGRRPKTALVVGVAEDPLVVSQAEHVQSVAAAGVLVGGFASPMSSPLVSGAPPAGAMVVNNAGNAPSWPVIRLDGPMTNPVVTFVESAGVLAFTYDLKAGEFLVIETNPRRRRVLLNGSGNRYSAYRFAASRWAPLLPGNNNVRLGLDAFSAPAALQVTWRDAW